MFCKKCGKEVIDGEKFCPDCGEAVEQTQAPQAPILSKILGGIDLNNLKVPTGNEGIAFYISAGLYLLMAIFMLFVKWFTMSASAMGMTNRQSYNLLIFGKLGNDLGSGTVLWTLVSIVLLLLVLAFIGCGVLYVLKRLSGDDSYQLFGLLGMAIAVLIFVIALIVAIVGSIAIKSYLKNVGMGFIDMSSMVKFYLGFGGYATLVLAVAGGIFVKKS